MLIYSTNLLRKLFIDFYNVTQLQICVFDDRFNPVEYYRSDSRTFCNQLHLTPSAKKQCDACDMSALKKCFDTGQMHHYICHLGLFEGVVPIKNEKRETIAFVMIGQVRVEDREDIDPKAFLKKHKLDESTFFELYSKTKKISMTRLQSTFNLLDSLVKQLDFSVVNEYMDITTANNIKVYLSHNYAEDIDAEHLCNRFYLSKSKLYRLFEQAFGTSVAKYIKTLRLDKACRLLRETNLPVSAISERVGYSDYNYFTKLVQAYTGKSPTAYRRTPN